MEFPLVVAAFFAFFVVAAAAHHFDTKRRKAAWALVAQNTGLSFRGDLLQGVIDDISLTVRIVSRGSGKSKQDYTILLMNLLGDLPNGLLIQPEGVLDKVAKLIGSQDIQLGLPEIDPKLMVKASDEDEARSWAGRAKVARGLTKLVTLRNYTFKLAANQLSFERRGAMDNAAELEALIRDLVAVVTDLSQSQAYLDSAAVDSESDDVSLW